MKKVWILYRYFLDLRTLEEEVGWWINKKEEGAKKGFESELEEYYEQYGEHRKEDCSIYQIEEGVVYLEVPGEHRFLLVYQEEPVFN